MKSNRIGKISFWLAVSPWLFVLPAMLRCPGFGRLSLRIPWRNPHVFGPPVSIVVSLVAIYMDRSNMWARIGSQ